MSRKLHVGNLPRYATDGDLRLKFSQFGTVVSAMVVKDGRTGRSRRFGYVEMASDAQARAAIDRLNMTQYDDATMSVSEFHEAGVAAK